MFLHSASLGKIDKFKLHQEHCALYVQLLHPRMAQVEPETKYQGLNKFRWPRTLLQ